MPLSTLSITVENKGDNTFLLVTTPQGTTLVGPLNFYYGSEPYNVPLRKPTEETYTGVIREQTTRNKVTPKKNKRTSIRTESATMEALGGQRQKGSGAVAWLKGDGRVRSHYRVEEKHTRTESYRVTRDELSKIRGECADLEIPLFVVNFLNKLTSRLEDSWVMLELRHFIKLKYKPEYETSNTD